MSAGAESVYSTNNLPPSTLTLKEIIWKNARLNKLLLGKFNNIYEKRLQQYSLKSGADNLLHYGRKNTNEISGELNFGDNAYYFSLMPSDEDTLFISREDSILPKKTKYQKSYYDENIKESLKGYFMDIFGHCKVKTNTSGDNDCLNLKIRKVLRITLPNMLLLYNV